MEPHMTTFAHVMSLHASENEGNTVVTCPSACTVGPTQPECFMHFFGGTFGLKIWKTCA